MKPNNQLTAALLEKLKDFFTKNWPVKLISLVFAMLLWGYVMMETNPDRTKIITDVPVSFSGENELHERGFAVRGDHDDILRSVTARVSVELTKYTGLDASDVSATVSLRSISKAGTYKLKVNSTCADGTVLSVSPSELVVEVDELATRIVPIEVEYAGELPEGYWKSEPTLGSQTISVSGPADDVSVVSKAICTIDLDNRTTSCNESILLSYVDAAGEGVSSALFLNQLPSVVVKMDVMRMITVPVNAEAAVLGRDSLAANYEVYDIVSTPPTVRLVGSESVLSEITGIDIEQIDVSGSSASVQVPVTLTAPEGTILLDEPQATIYVDIRERQESLQLQGIPIEIRGLAEGLSADLSYSEGDIIITGKISHMRRLERKDVALYVDLTGLVPGSYDVEMGVDIADDTMQTELEWILSVPKVTVTVKE
ncbi:MAG: hypothetical protein IJB30_07215 [Clostridia bacterium]|nr:hypothetical protein [Clostridia bacterium]